MNMPNQPERKNKRPSRRIVQDKNMQTNYANMVRVVHSPNEFAFDFGQMIPGDMLLPMKSRIIMTPIGAKLLLKALQDNLNKYEAVHGEIHLPERPTLADQLFKNIHITNDEGSPDDADETDNLNEEDEDNQE